MTATTSRLKWGEVHVFVADVESGQQPREESEAFLSEEERARAGRFRFDRDRDRYVGSQALLRVKLGSYLGVGPEAVQFGARENGKPILAGESSGSDLRFNLAHSGGRAACAFALGREVGVDIEQVVTRDDLESLSSRIFAPEEIAVLAKLEGNEWLEAFYNCWTRKEAVLKASGEGLRVPLDQFVVSTAPEGPIEIVKAAAGINELLALDLKAIDAGPGFKGAVAFERGAILVQTG